MIRILYGNIIAAENIPNMKEAKMFCENYLNLMINNQLTIQELKIEITSINKPKRIIIIKETLPAQLLSQSSIGVQNELLLSNRVQ